LRLILIDLLLKVVAVVVVDVDVDVDVDVSIFYECVKEVDKSSMVQC